jgi:hypothetical protein
MLIIMSEDPVKEVDTDTLLRLKYGKGAKEAFAKDCRQQRKVCEDVQSSFHAADRHPLGKLMMQLPAALFFADTLKSPDFWQSEDGKKRLALLWDEFPDCRRAKVKGNRNPFGKTGFTPRTK